MKKIFLILAVLISAETVFSQGAPVYPAYFPSVDSLRRYTDKYIRNSAIEAFTNLRMNTALKGIHQFLDSARLTWGGGGSGGEDTLNDGDVDFSKTLGDIFNTVVAIQGIPVHTVDPTDGQILKYIAANGRAEWATGGGSEPLDATLVLGNTTDEKMIFQPTASETAGMNWWEGRPSNYNTVYSGYGKAKSFTSEWIRVNGVNASGRPNVVWQIWGYNASSGGGRTDNAEAAISQRLETHFEVGGNIKLFEYHQVNFIDTTNMAHRLMSWYIDKGGQQRAAPQFEGGGIGFVKWNDQLHSWGGISDDGQIYVLQQFGANPPKFKLGSEVLWTNPKWNYEMTWVDSTAILMGRPSTVAADNAKVTMLDNFYVGTPGTTSERSLVVSGSTNFAATINVSPTFYFNSSHAGVTDIFRVDYASSRRMVISKDATDFYKPVILANTVDYTWMVVGTTAQRPGSANRGFFRINSDTTSGTIEVFDATDWRAYATRNWVRDNFSGGGGGGGAVSSVFGRTGAVVAVGTDYDAFYFKDGGNAHGANLTIGATDANDLIIISGGTEVGRWRNSTGKLEVVTGLNVGGAAWASAPVEFNSDVAIGPQLRMLNGSSVLQANSGTELKMNVGGFGRVVIAGGQIGYDAGTYINYGTTYGSTGYGFRDNSGTLEFKNSGGSWAAFGSGGGVTDGDKGDITVTSSGSVWSIDGDVVTFAKMQNITTNRLLGRSTASTGDIEELTIGTGLSLSGGTLTATAGGVNSLVIIDDADYTVAAGVTDVVFKRLTANRTLTLPSASSNTNRVIYIANGGNGAFNLTLSVAIRENSTTTLSAIGQNERVKIVSDGTEWWVLLI